MRAILRVSPVEIQEYTMKNKIPSVSKNQSEALIQNTILEIGFPPCPELLNNFILEMQCDEPDLIRLVTIINNDVALSAGLIKTANSPFFGIRQRVRSVNEALLMLGLKKASGAVACLILKKSFPHVHHLERFWDSSARIARLSGWLAQRLSIATLQPEDAYTFGLFRDCGIPVLLGYYPDYTEILGKANADKNACYTDIELLSLPTHHAIMGSILAQSWCLPDEICQAISHHHDKNELKPDQSSLHEQSLQLIATAQLAEHLIQKQLGLSMTQEWDKLGEICLALLNIDQQALEAIYTDATDIVSSDE